jgi:dihydroxyacetone kinase-like protein
LRLLDGDLMAATITTADLKAAAKRIAAGVASASDELNALDGQLGDGDLGVTVGRGWQAVADAADTFPDDMGKAFLAAAKAFQSVSSSSFGTLVATAFMSAAKQTMGKTSVPASDVPQLLAAARDAMMARGKGALGDKTVLDSLEAVIGALPAADPQAMASAADKAAAAALDAFRDRPNKLGRARMFAEKSVGLDDPGMMAFRRIVAALA